MRRVFLSILLVGLSSTLAACSGVTSPNRPSSARATVERVVDGDTVDLRFGSGRERVRLLGIDTPETVKPNTTVQCFGPEASARAKALLPHGTAVRVERDAEPRDRFGRLLLYLYRVADGLFVNRALVAGGYARTLRIVPNVAHAADLYEAAAAAQQAGWGLWSSCAGSPRTG